MLRILLLFLSIDLGLCITTNINRAVDKILIESRQKIIQDGFDMRNIPEFVREYSFGYHFNNKMITAKFDCTDGWIKNISTIRRTGDVILSGEGEKIALRASFGLTQLELGFDKCTIGLDPFFNLYRNFSISIRDNSMVAQVTAKINEKNLCRPKLDFFNLTRANEITVHTGYGLWEEMKEKVISAIIEFYHKDVVTIIQTEFRNLAIKLFESGTFC